MYPMVMFTVAITVMVFMLVKVVPILLKCIRMGVALPTPTAVIMTGSNFMRGSGGLTLLIVLIVSFAVFKYPTTKVWQWIYTKGFKNAIW